VLTMIVGVMRVKMVMVIMAAAAGVLVRLVA
jgi:hypothetical protein